MKELICIMCPKGCHLTVDETNDYEITGHSCSKGVKYGKAEVTNPVRTITSTIIIEGAAYRRCPVKTADSIPKELVQQAIAEIDQLKVKAPVKVGDVAIENLLDTGIDVVITRNMS